MKTLLISEIFPPTHGGSGRWFWELYTRLPRHDYMIAAGQSPTAQEFDQTHDLSVERINLSSPAWGIASKKGLSFYWKTFWTLRKLIKKDGVSKIHCGRCLPEGVMGLLLKKLMGIPYLCYIHGEDIETAVTSRELTTIVSWVLKNANTLICNSKSTASIVESYWPGVNHKIEILNPSVDTVKFTPATPSDAVKTELGWPIDKQVILTVGRLQRRKGHDMMIKAMKEIITAVPNTIYVIVGDGDQLPTLQQLTAEFGLQDHIIFCREINDDILIKSYQQCDIFILPNRRDGADIEGFGMVLVEAQACGKPVIAGDSGGTAETMKMGETGFVVDCTDEKIIADTVTRLINNSSLRENMGTAATTHVNKTLNWQAHTEKALTIFHHLPD